MCDEVQSESRLLVFRAHGGDQHLSYSQAGSPSAPEVEVQGKQLQVVLLLGECMERTVKGGWEAETGGCFLEDVCLRLYEVCGCVERSVVRVTPLQQVKCFLSSESIYWHPPWSGFVAGGLAGKPGSPKALAHPPHCLPGPHGKAYLQARFSKEQDVCWGQGDRQ